jgi:hypothetical protein
MESRHGMKVAASVGGLRWGDKTLSAPAIRAFIDVMHETRLVRLDAATVIEAVPGCYLNQ